MCSIAHLKTYLNRAWKNSLRSAKPLLALPGPQRLMCSMAPHIFTRLEVSPIHLLLFQGNDRAVAAHCQEQLLPGSALMQGTSCGCPSFCTSPFPYPQRPSHGWLPPPLQAQHFHLCPCVCFGDTHSGAILPLQISAYSLLSFLHLFTPVVTSLSSFLQIPSPALFPLSIPQ